MKLDATKVMLFLSLLLNALGGSGIVPPLSGAAPGCPQIVSAPVQVEVPAVPGAGGAQ